jgi:hypothetical protein
MLGTGIALGLGFVFLGASVQKGVRIQRFELSLYRLLPRAVWRTVGTDTRVVAYAVVMFEAALGAALLATHTAVPEWLAVGCTAVLATMLVTVVAAVRRGTACGCSNGRKPAGPLDVVRTATLLATSILLVIDVGFTAPSSERPIVAAAAFVAVLGAYCLPFLANGFRRVERILRAARRPAVATVGLGGGAGTSASGGPLTRRRLLASSFGAAAGVLALGVWRRDAWLAWACVPVPGNYFATCTFYFNVCQDCCGGQFLFPNPGGPGSADCLLCCSNCDLDCLEGGTGAIGGCCGRTCPDEQGFRCWLGC